jgi:hypothetical protein
LHYKAFPWFEIMQEFNRENGSKNTSLELIKNSTNTGCSGAENGEKEKWYGLVFSVRMEILKW